MTNKPRFRALRTAISIARGVGWSMVLVCLFAGFASIAQGYPAGMVGALVLGAICWVSAMALPDLVEVLISIEDGVQRLAGRIDVEGGSTADQPPGGSR